MLCTCRPNERLYRSVCIIQLTWSPAHCKISLLSSFLFGELLRSTRPCPFLYAIDCGNILLFQNDVGNQSVPELLTNTLDSPLSSVGRTRECCGILNKHSALIGSLIEKRQKSGVRLRRSQWIGHRRRHGNVAWQRWRRIRRRRRGRRRHRWLRCRRESRAKLFHFELLGSVQRIHIHIRRRSGDVVRIHQSTDPVLHNRHALRSVYRADVGVEE